MAKKAKVIQYTMTETVKATGLSSDEIWEYINEGPVQPFYDEKKGYMYFNEAQIEIMKRFAGVK